ncbi:unnamed protein product [Durusdinium trenchii]|uniref:WW domain-containing protein n=1 Tax=Durusdinium trenchii TaxID=1381693 RepID=A0ABP0MP34_9DINO
MERFWSPWNGSKHKLLPSPSVHGLRLGPRAPYRGTVVPPGPASGYPPEAQDPLQKVLDRFTSTGHVRNQATGGALAQAAAQASIYVPELQEQLYENMMAPDDGWLEVESPSGRIYYWNQFTQEEWEPEPS